jgi:aquaporin Z
VAPYIVAQTLGAILGALILYGIAIGNPKFDLASSNFACNGFTHGDGFDHSPGHYSLIACMTTEIVLTFIFSIVIIGSTDKRAPAGFAPIAIGLSLTALHLVGIPVTNMSVNPSRSTATALVLALNDTWALQQLWLFWVAPIVGGFLAGAVYRSLWPDAEPTKPA